MPRIYVRLNRKSDCHPDRPHYGHGLCFQCWRKTQLPKIRARDRERYWRDPEAGRAKNRTKYAINPARYRNNSRRYAASHRDARRHIARRCMLRRLYNISVDQYDALVAQQGGVCAICGGQNATTKRLFVDHDHASRHVRGLLCNVCNRGIGAFHDDTGLLRKAADYLARPIS